MAEKRPRGADRSAAAPRAEVARLEAEVARLNKVVRVLMDRAESTASAPATDYGLSQTTVMLQNQVRLSTEEARAALRGVEGAAGGPDESASRHARPASDRRPADPAPRASCWPARAPPPSSTAACRVKASTTGASGGSSSSCRLRPARCPAPARPAAHDPTPARRTGRSAGAPREQPARELIAALQHVLEAVFGSRRIAFLSLAMPSLAAALVAVPGDGDDDPAAPLLAGLKEAAARAAVGRDVVVGCSAPLTGAAGGPRALQQALVACLAARRGPAAGGAFDELAGQLRLLDGLDAAQLVS